MVQADAYFLAYFHHHHHHHHSIFHTTATPEVHLVQSLNTNKKKYSSLYITAVCFHGNKTPKRKHSHRKSYYQTT